MQLRTQFMYWGKYYSVPYWLNFPIKSNSLIWGLNSPLSENREAMTRNAEKPAAAKQNRKLAFEKEGNVYESTQKFVFSIATLGSDFWKFMANSVIRRLRLKIRNLDNGLVCESNTAALLIDIKWRWCVIFITHIISFGVNKDMYCECCAASTPPPPDMLLCCSNSQCILYSAVIS